MAKRGSRKSAIGAVLAHARAEAGMTQTQLAAEIGRTQAWVSKYENGQLALDFDEVAEIAAMLGVSMQVVLQRWSKERTR
jgi:transcriptional regulator with XRE-family HTH domain